MKKTDLAPGLEIRPSPIDGRGCFAAVAFKQGRKIVEYAGERISRREVARRLKNKRRIHISNINSYWAIDGSRGGNGSQFINHSCEPNCQARIVHGHLLFFALRDIEAGEELLLDYGESYHSDKKRCKCGAATCRRRINK